MRVYLIHPDFIPRMCRPYRYQVQVQGCNSKAFVKRSAFRLWLKERGLRLQKTARGSAVVIGDLRRVYTPDLPAEGLRTMALCNGEYVPCVIQRENGGAVEYVLHKPLAAIDYSDEAMKHRLAEHRKYDAIYG